MGRKKGFEHSSETKEKIKKGNQGLKRSDDFKKRNSKIHFGKITSDETKKKMSDAHKRRVLVDSEHYLMLVDCAKYHDQTLSECLSKLLELAFEKLNHHEGGRF